MKKIILLFILILGFQACCSATEIRVEAMSSFTTANPPSEWQVKTVEDVEVKDKGIIPAESIISGKIVNVKSPSRGKRDAQFTFVPTSVNVNGEEYKVVRNFSGKYSSKGITAGGIAKKGVVAVGNKIFDGVFGPSVAIVEGAIKNETGNVVKSAAVSFYESTPLSFVEKGSEIVIPVGSQFVMNFVEQK